jgi:hypothetical protein
VVEKINSKKNLKSSGVSIRSDIEYWVQKSIHLRVQTLKCITGTRGLTEQEFIFKTISKN